MQSSLTSAFLAVAILAHPVFGKPRMETWTAPDGKTFKGTPTGLYGPFAMFETGKTGTRGLRLRGMSTDDCVRFYNLYRELPERAADWANTSSPLSGELLKRGLVLKDGDIGRAELAGRPEPEFFLIVYGNHDDQYSWDAINAVKPVYERLQATYPDLIEAVFVGIQHNSTNHIHILSETGISWLTGNVEVQHRECPVLLSLRPLRTPSAVVMNRHGSAIYGSSQPSVKDILKTLTDFETLLVNTKPNRATNVPDLRQYLTATQPLAYQTGKCGPTLLAQPLDLEALRGAGIKRVDANFTIGPDHSVLDVHVFDNGGVLPENIVEQLAVALKNAIFVAGVENGKFVESVYEMHLVLEQ